MAKMILHSFLRDGVESVRTLDALLLAEGQGDDVRLLAAELLAFFTGTTSVAFLARLLFRFKPFVLTVPCQIHTVTNSLGPVYLAFEIGCSAR